MGLLDGIKVLDIEKQGLHIVTDQELADTKLLLIDMLDLINDICLKNDIKWGLCGGSCLGAVRHSGFIPWDDDVDIAMSRREFERFRQSFYQEKQDRYELCIPGDEGFYSNVPKIFDKDTIYQNLASYGDSHDHLFIDIYVLEDTYDNKVLRILHGVQSTIYLGIIGSLVTHKRMNLILKYGNENLIKEAKKRNFISFFFSFRKIEKWIRSGNRCFSKVNNPNSILVVSPGGRRHYFRELYKREAMCWYKLMDFEKKKYPVVKDTDYFLRVNYGDSYKELPPVEKREKHPAIKIDLKKAMEKHNRLKERKTK